jgi:REP element-mobilizing transposase RayT
MSLPGIPSQVVQRGNDRNSCFYEEDNYLFLLDCLGDACERYDVAIHAYVLMTNHIRLLNECTVIERYFVQAWMLGMFMICEKQWRFLYRSETLFLKNGLRRH